MASSVDRFSRYAQIGYKVRCCLASCMARWISKPMIALPTGSWSARGRRLPGETGGFRGLGMRNNHPCLQLAGMIGGEKDHHSLSLACMSGARNFACWRQTTPGANGRAVARVLTIRLRAFSNWSTVNGTPGGRSNFRFMQGGPCHVSATNLFKIAALSNGVAM